MHIYRGLLFFIILIVSRLIIFLVVSFKGVCVLIKSDSLHIRHECTAVFGQFFGIKMSKVNHSDFTFFTLCIVNTLLLSKTYVLFNNKF